MTVALGEMQLPVTEDADRVRDYLNGTIADGGLWTALGRSSNHDHTGGVNGKALSIAAIPDGSITTAKLDPAVLLPYALVDGSKPFTGQVTMQADAIVRDTLYFGEQGTALPPDATLSRARAGVLRLDSHLGVGITQPAWDPAYRTVYAGVAGLFGRPDTTSAGIRVNSIYDGTNKAIIAGPGVDLNLASGALEFYSAPFAAAGGTQAMARRLAIASTGTLTLNSDTGAQAIDIQQNGTDINGIPSILLRRGVAASQHQTIRFQNGATLGDYDIGRRAGSDDLRFMFWNGASLTDRFVFTPAGMMQINPAGAAANLEIGRAGQGFSAGASTNGVEVYGFTGPMMHFSPITAFHRAASLGEAAKSWGPIFGDSLTAQGTLNLVASGGNMHVNPSGTIFGPLTDGVCNLGYSSVRWAQIWSTIPSISTSHVSMKHDFARLDPAACAAAVLETDWLSFAYNDPPMAPYLPLAAPAEIAYDEHDDNEVKAEKKAKRDALDAEQRADFEATYRAMVAETADSRKQNGYVLGSDEYHTADLFGTPDRRNASTHADLAVVACALQDALLRIAALEGRPN